MNVNLKNLPFARIKLNDKWFVVKYQDEDGKDVYMFCFINKVRTMEIFADEELAEVIMFPYIEAGYNLGLETTYPEGRNQPYYFYDAKDNRVFLHLLAAQYKGLINKASKTNPISKKIWFWDGITSHLHMGNIDLLERINKGKMACAKSDRKLAKAS